ncbi:UDP-glucose/GDP-mannose dehydrogenase family protein [bacterium]|nr:UDP-glucose/GDP-mannose dehydrogenase family protein [bacterium]MCI0617813.1 UDP-glucose/GDP-mannose dehydrogenase family protein [bacterium]
MNIAVIGTGYVGLVTGSVFADLGNDVICVDKDSNRIEQLLQGKIPFYEPGLEELVKRNMDDHRLSFTTDLTSAVKKSDVIFIAVGTPSKANGETDLSQVQQAAEGIGHALDRYKVIVNKSTVPVGTVNIVKNIIEKVRKDNVKFEVVSNPEFLREGSAIQDMLSPDRIVIGAPNQQVALTLLELYASLGCPMLITDVESAELIKYASNAFLAMKISFANAIADLCERTGADVVHVINGMGHDKRIGHHHLQPGLGYGGSCFPKDVDSLIQTARKFDYDFSLLKSAADVNRNRIQRFINNVESVVESIENKTFALLGLSFKPDTDDMREAKSIEVIDELLKRKAKIRAYDPAAIENAKKIFGKKVYYAKNAYDAAKDADCTILLTEWREFKLLNMERLRDAMKTPVFFDGRNLYSPDRMKKIGFKYYGIGRKANSH